MDLHQRILTEFHRRFDADPEYIARAPGRVNLLGEHVDYNEGIVLPAAIDRVTLVAFRKSRASTSTILALDLGEEISFDLSSVLNRQESTGFVFPAWARYPAGVMWSLNAEGLDTPPMEAVFASEVPRGAGLSSSASVELAFGVAWERLGGWTLAPIELAKICLKAEMHYVGLKCGIMDQFASACGVKERLLYLDCRSLEWRTVRMPEETAIVIADTSVRRSLVSSGYNKLQAACEESVRILKEILPGIRSLRDVSVEQFHKLAGHLPDLVSKRAQHVVEEIARTLEAVESLENNDAIRFGELMNECHTSLRDLYDVSCPELDVMVALAQSLPGCYGARLTGAGFGGCTVNLVACESTDNFTHDLESGFSKITGLKPEIFICHATDGAEIVPEWSAS